jgi:MSHA biogenesis protein MshN
MRMSLELSTVPLPSGLRSNKTLQRTPEQAPALAQVKRNAEAPLIDNAGKQVAEAATGTAGKSSVHVEKSADSSESMTTGIDKKVRQVTVQQQAEIEFRKANNLMQEGRIDEAIAGYRSALQLDEGHDAARQALVGLLLESKRNNDAEQVLQEGLGNNPKHSGFAMLLARLQVERNALPQALETLQKTLPSAEQQADYQAFIAAILQRLNRHEDAIDHYQIALQLSPNSGVWLMGLGISLQAEKRNDAARAAFRQAVDSHTLNADLQAYVTQRLRELNP